MKNLIFILIGIALIIGALWVANKRTDALMAIGECVDRKTEEYRFPGNPEQAWEAFAGECANEQ